MSIPPSFDATPRRLSDQLATYLRNEIYAGRLRPGQRLFEVELCERLNVSRAPLREAILTLRTDGLVDVRPHRGAVVTTLEDDDIREVFVLFELEGLSGPEISEALGIPLKTVWTRLHHARKDFEQRLAQEPQE